MSNYYEYTGVVEEVLPLQTFSSGFSKQDLILTDSVDSQSRYPSYLPFTFKKDNVSLLNGLRKGQSVKVRFAIDGRKWTNPQGQVKYFTDLTALKLEILDGDGSSTEPLPEPAEPADGITELGGDFEPPF